VSAPAEASAAGDAWRDGQRELTNDDPAMRRSAPRNLLGMFMSCPRNRKALPKERETDTEPFT
jgi:hypothetical protein